MNYTLSHSKQSKPKAFPKSKTFIPTLYSKTITLYKGKRCVLRSQTPLYILTQRKQVKNLPKVIPHIIYHKETKSHVSP
jgi:hypothetical protein